MGVLEAGGQVDFAKEPIGTQDDSLFWPEQLDGDPSGMTQVAGPVHYGHPAGPQLAFELVATA